MIVACRGGPSGFMTRSFLHELGGLAWVAWLAIPIIPISFTALAQPVVAIKATIAETREPSPDSRVQPGQFTIAREGPSD
jgi:hypothetical protein